MSNVSDAEMDRARSPGVIEILREGVSIAVSIPLAFGLYAIPAVANVFSTYLGGLVSPIVAALVTVMAYSAMGGEVQVERSRILLVVFVVVAYLVTYVAAGIAGILLIIPGLYVAYRLSLTTAAIMIEAQGPLAGLKRSWALAGGNVWTIFGVNLAFLAVGLVIFVVALLVGGGIPSGANAATGLQTPIGYGSAITGVLTGPIQVACNVFMFDSFRGQ